MLRVVIDTNVFVRGLLSRQGTPSKILDHWRGGRYLLITSPAIMLEMRRVLEAPSLKKRYGIGQGEIEQLMDLLKKDAVVLPDSSIAKRTVLQDPDDEKFLACAMDGGADLIVTGDRHLLVLGEHQGIPIVTVNDFMDRTGPSTVSG